MEDKMSAVTKEEVTEAMYNLVKDNAGKKKFKPMDLTKEMIAKYGDPVDKKLCKEALKDLIASGRAVYTYFGASYVEIPHEEGAAK
jgi:hypothetical protein